MPDTSCEQRYQALISSIDEGFCVVEVRMDNAGQPVDYRFVEVNPAFERHTGLRDVVGKSMRGLAPDHEEHWFEAFGRVARTGEPIRFVHCAQAPENRWFDVSAFRIGAAEDRLVGILIQDITAQRLIQTERHRAERALRKSERQCRLMVENVRDYAVFLTDSHGVITSWNVGAERLLGWCEEQIVGKPGAIIFTPEDRAAGEHVKEIETARRTGHAANERWHMRRDGSRFFGSGMMMAIVEDEQVVGFTKIMRDETARKLAEDAMRQARLEAEAANRAKDRFLAVLSHELRTPLTPVALAAASMEMDPALPFEFRQDVAMIRRNVELETRLIDDLLDLSRVISGKLRLNRQPTHVHHAVRHVIETVRSELAAKNLALRTACDAASDVVDADPARLQQVLWNLLKNAGKFTPPGGTISVRTRNEPDQLVLEVADSGRGIEPDLLPRVFEPFEQGTDETTRLHGGMGLGLAIAKAVVDLHGGTIHAHSEGVGHGATFTVALPLHQPSQPAAASEASQPGAQPAGRNLRVLLVEDHPDTAKVLARLLRLEGFDVQIGNTVAQGIELSAAGRFDLVISDLRLPDGSGHDLMRKLLEIGPCVGIALSGYGMEEDLRRSRDAGFVDHLVKPVSLDQLKTTIHRVVKAHWNSNRPGGSGENRVSTHEP